MISERFFKMSEGWEKIRLRVETKNISTPRKDNRTISSHILDTSSGKAAANIIITIYRLENHTWQRLHSEPTNEDGRVSQLVSADQFRSGTYKLHFDVKSYFEKENIVTLYPFIEIVITCAVEQHYHIPLLLNPFGYSTYRGT